MVKVLLGEMGFGESEKGSGIPNRPYCYLRQLSEGWPPLELLTLHLRH